MNEPKRNQGYYWVKIDGEWHLAYYRHGVNDPHAWTLTAYINDSWWLYDSDFEEINEKQIIKEV